MKLSTETLYSLEKPLNVSIALLREKKPADSIQTNTESNENTNNTNSNKLETEEKAGANIQKYSKDFLIRKNFDEEDFIEVRVAVVGNVDSGKSTLLGVLTHGVLDDGRGEARTKLFRHKHEIESGRTSSVGNDILGFDGKGKIVNDTAIHGAKMLDWESICRASSKVLTFIDLAGHEKYLKTTVFGMTGHAPDFCMLMVGANMGEFFFFLFS